LLVVQVDLVVQVVMVEMEEDIIKHRLMVQVEQQVDLELHGQDVVDILVLVLLELVEQMEILVETVETVETGVQ
tara:strand:- start:59 stop:280 length:222 start_codon:yes stop_codon:yes gene_type:complete